MNRTHYADGDYRQPNVPPATPPVIDPGASARDAADLPDASGDSDAPGSRPAHFAHGRAGVNGAGDRERGHGGKGDEVDPGRTPDEVVPDKGDVIDPSAPDEIDVEQGDTIEPGSTPDEIKPAAPPETLLPPG